MARVSHVERTLKLLAAGGAYPYVGRTEAFRGLAGRQCFKCKTFLPPQGAKTDLFGIFDYMGMSTDHDIVGIQVCGGGGDYGRHRDKLMASDEFEFWVECGGRVMLIGWRKVVLKRGGKAMRWRPWISIWGDGFYNEDNGIKRDETGRLMD